MMQKIPRILVAGDSFAAPWKGPYYGWAELLAHYYKVTNLAQAGVGEYKILQQLKTQDLQKFDCVIVSHTSPSRVHTKEHPVHKKGLHQNCDLIFTDLEGQDQWFNESLKTAKNWFKYHYDDRYQTDIYKLIRQEINNLISIPYISLTHLDIDKSFNIEKNVIDFSEFWQHNKGLVNHYSEYANQEICQQLRIKIEEITC